MITQPAHVTFVELMSVLERRKKLLLFPPVLVTIISIAAAFLMPRLYESSTRLLIQRTEVVNPLTHLANAMMQTNDDPLQYFDEIIFSQRTIEELIDSLGLKNTYNNETEHRMLGDK